MRPLHRWPDLFDFSAEQRAQVDDLANRMGVTGCRQQIEAFYRGFAGELASPPLRPTPAEKQRMEQMKREFNRFGYPCMVKMQDVLEQLPNLMTPKQRQDNAKLLASFKEDLAGSRKVLRSPNTYRGIY